MLWFYLSIAAAVCGGLSILTIKHNVDHYLVGAEPNMALVGFMNLIYALISFLFFDARFVSLEFGWYAVFAGALSFLGFYLSQRAFVSEEASRMNGIFRTFPIVVAVLAALFLGEILNTALYLSIALVVLGSSVLALRVGEEGGFRIKRVRGLKIIASAVVLISVSFVIDKYVLMNIDYVDYLLWHFLGFGTVGALFSLFPFVRSSISETLRKSGKFLPLAFILLGESMGLSRFFLRTYAMSFGPVSLVSTVSSASPVFVLLFAIPLIKIWPDVIREEIGKKAVVLKMIGILLIVGGIYLIS